MEQLLLLIILAALLFLGFVLFIIRGLIKKSKKNIFVSLGFLLATICISVFVIYNFAAKSYREMTTAF